MKLPLLLLLTLVTLSHQQRSRPEEDENDYRQLPDEADCGASENYRIFRGKNASVYDHPWYATLYINKMGQQSRCGGSLISSRFILSAAHCFYELDEWRNHEITQIHRFVTAKLGEHKINVTCACDEEEISDCICSIPVPLDKVRKHDKYRGKTESFKNDIAIVKMAHSIFFNTNDELSMRPICLPNAHHKSMNFKDVPLSVTGFGKTGIRGRDGTLADTKQITELKIISEALCKQAFARRFQFNEKSPPIRITISPDIQLCAKGDNGTDTCQGDSGGPVVYNNKYLIGIVSFGSDECGKGFYPAVFTRVSNYVDWIKRTIQEL